ncbi:MAG: DNA repair exonuclease [Clostridia bacterium]|nr:DNA repair exonuclease [Clostridia bacterium]
MKFIHCSDIHLDSKINELPKEKRSLRKEELITTFERLCSFAVSNNVKAVIIAGDMFDKEKITSKTLARVLNAIKKAESVDFLYLPGNHEQNGFLQNKDIFPNNLKCFSEEWTEFNYGKVCINGIVLNDYNQGVVYDNLKLDKEKVNIVTMHGQVAGYKAKEEAEIISIPSLKDKHVDYLALGHYHSYSLGEIDYRGKYVYSGCLEGRGFDELGDKGFVLLDVDENKLTPQFIKFSTRELFEVKVSVEGLKDFIQVRENVLSLLENKISPDSIVKVVLTGEHKLDLDVDVEGLTLALNKIYFYAKVYDKTSILVTMEDYENDKSVRGEFVRLVISSDLEENVKAQILRKGLSALRGE